MNDSEREALEAAGVRVGDAGDFLGLTDEERRVVELRVAISRAVRRLREARGLTQQQVAAAMKSTQARVAKIEAGVGGVSLDLMFRGLFAVGGGVADLAEPTAKGRSRRAGRRTAGARRGRGVGFPSPILRRRRRPDLRPFATGT